MTITWRADRWLGNQWASIDITPVDEQYFLPLLWYLSQHYDFAMPPVIDAITGYMAKFMVLGSPAMISIDTYDFSIAFADDDIRDHILAHLQMVGDIFGKD